MRNEHDAHQALTRTASEREIFLKFADCQFRKTGRTLRASHRKDLMKNLAASLWDDALPCVAFVALMVTLAFAV